MSVVREKWVIHVPMPKPFCIHSSCASTTRHIQSKAVSARKGAASGACNLARGREQIGQDRAWDNCAESHIGEPERSKVQTDASNACTPTQSIANEPQRHTNKSERVSRPQNDRKKPNLPGRSPESRIGEPQRPGDHADASGRHMHMQNGRIDTKTTTKIVEDISQTSKEPKLPNSPVRAKTRHIGLGEPRGWVDQAHGHTER